MPECDAVIDLSHFNQNPDFVQARAAGILGVFHKSTQGTSFFDPTYLAHRDAARAAGLLWGAYHFGTGADGVEQAEFFLRQVQPGPDVLLALDFEANPQGPSMTLDQARAFVTQVQGVMGRYPGLYGGGYLKQLLGASHDPVLAKCWLWLAQYGPTAIVPPNWETWTMWQCTNGLAGLNPQPVPGVGRCDRDKFNGTPDELETFWNPAAGGSPT